MARDGVIAVVFNAEGTQVLLHKREDFRIWALPGGGIEAGETPDAAAIRETGEETGYIIEIIRCVGKYVRPQLGDTLYVFEGVIIGGAAIQQGAETLAVQWFPVHDLPKSLIWNTECYVRDTLTKHPTPLKITLTYPCWQILLRSVALTLRNIRNCYLR
jgi:8-oxo-dGTP pyrophosphatase MutT (NUDIX family)